MNRNTALPRVLLGLLLAGTLSSGVVVAADGTNGQANLSDLTLENFFTEGWDQDYVKRERATPDMALLKVTTNFLERELRLDYVRTADIKASKFADTDSMQALIAYALNRRFMVEVISNYQWNTPLSPNAGVSGAGGGVLARFQLIDTPTTSISLQGRALEPNRSIGQTQTELTYALGGFNDLQALLNLNRVGLYYSVQLDDFVGNRKPGQRYNDVAYDISLAKTWTDPQTPVFGNLTTFLEAFATSDLSGTTSSTTVATLTPGVRFWFLPANSLMLGVDLPITNPKPNDYAFRATYILNF